MRISSILPIPSSIRIILGIVLIILGIAWFISYTLGSIADFKEEKKTENYTGIWEFFYGILSIFIYFLDECFIFGFLMVGVGIVFILGI